MDTIELSNLNRQFLFRKHHIGQAKCLVACEVIREMLPSTVLGSLDLKAHFGNIKDTQLFPASFFSRFDVVLNALDNVGENFVV